jgi:hypothetical protein
MKPGTMTKLKHSLSIAMLAITICLMSSCSRQTALYHFSGPKTTVDAQVTENDLCRPHPKTIDNTPVVDVAIPNVFELQPMLPPTQRPHTSTPKIIEKKVVRTISRSIEKSSVFNAVIAEHTKASSSYPTPKSILLVSLFIGMIAGGALGSIAYVVAVIDVVDNVA